MRVITYVPSVHGADRTRRSIERDVRRKGHEIIGHTASRTEAQAALDAGIADMIAGRPEHLLDLAPWAMGVTSRAAAAKSTALVLPLWAATQVRKHPGRTATVAGATAGLAAVVAFALPDREPPARPSVLPPAPPGASALYWGPSAAPPPPTLAPAPATPPPSNRRETARPPASGAQPPSRPAQPARQPLSRGPSAPVQPSSVPPATAPPSTVPTAPPPPACLITLDTPILDIRLCLA